MDVFSLNEQLNSFRGILNSGRGNLLDPVTKLLEILVTIEIIFAGIYLAIGGNANVIEICKKILKVGTLFWIIKFYPTIIEWIYTGFLYIGMIVGGSPKTGGLEIATLQNPDAILSLATNFINQLWQYFSTRGATNAIGLPTLTTIVILICAIPAYISLGLMAINVFITYLEFTMIGSLAFGLVPFAIFKPFSWLFDRAQGAVMSLGIKAMVLALIVSMADTILRTHPLPKLLTAPVLATNMVDEATILSTVTFTNTAQFFIMCLTLLILSFHAPSLAVTLLGGGPQLTAGSIASAIRGTAIGAQTSKSFASGSARMASNAASSAVMGTLGAAAKLGGGVRGAMQALGTSSEPGAKGASQLKTKGMAAMYGAYAATAGEAVNRVEKATVGKFVSSLEAKEAKGKALGQKAINASKRFNKKKPENENNGEQ